MKAFKQLNTESAELNRVQDNVSSSLDPIIGLPILNGTLVESVALFAGQDNNVSHMLGRKARGWILARQDSNSVVWEKAAVLPERQLNLWCSANCTISLWVI